MALDYDIVVFGDSWVNERDRLTKHLVSHFRQSSGLSGAGLLHFSRVKWDCGSRDGSFADVFGVDTLRPRE